MFRKRFLTVKGGKYLVVNILDVAIISFENRILYVIGFDNIKFIISGNLGDIEQELDPNIFFRVNRQMIINIHAFDYCENYFNGRLSLHLINNLPDKIMISRTRAILFRKWLDS